MRKLFVIGFVMLGLTVYSQKTLKLELNHVFGQTPFIYETNYTDREDSVISYISRLQYYLSGFELSLENGELYELRDIYVLASANISEYVLDSNYISTSNIDSLKFDLGVDALANHEDPTQYDDSHPLALQEPSMHWGWSAGYRFIALEGKGDANGDSIPESIFEMHVTGDDKYLTPIPAFLVETIETDSSIVLKVVVDVEALVVDLDLERVGYNHGVSEYHGYMLGNIRDGLVFNNKVMLESLTDDSGNEAGDTLNSVSDIEENFNITVNNTNLYSPTIFYQLPSENGSFQLLITDIQGKLIRQDYNLYHEGNYFLNMELESGIYLISFRSESGKLYNKKFVIN